MAYTSDDYAGYYDVYGPGGMADDRDDSNDPEFRDPDGYCPHGTYTGGCGTDWMCSWCEDGVSVAEMREIIRAERTRKVRGIATKAQIMLATLLEHGVPGITAYDAVQDYSGFYVCNPRSRYGRH